MGWLLGGPAWEEVGQDAACWQPAEVRCRSGDTEGGGRGGRKPVFWGEACLTPWGKGGQPVREDKSILAKPVSVSVSAPPPPPGFQPCLVSRFLAGSQARGSLLGRKTAPAPSPLLLRLPPRAHGGFGAASRTLKQQWGKVAQTARPRLSLLFLGAAAPALLWNPRDALSREIQPGRNSRAGGANKKHFSGGLF